MSLGFEWGFMEDPAKDGITRKISSRHNGVINVAFCDGHQASINTELDYSVYRQLMTPNSRGVWNVTGWSANMLPSFSTMSANATSKRTYLPVLDESKLGL
jgi:prepilin-type processing-associated H-X9-DG protein